MSISAKRKRKKESVCVNSGVYGTVEEHALIGRSDGGSMERHDFFLDDGYII